MGNFFHKTVQISKFASIEKSIRGTNTYIGENCFIDDFVKIKHVGGNGDVRIANRVYINSGCVLYSGNGIIIGDDVLIGPNCSITPVNHNFESLHIPIKQQGFSPSKGGVIIEENVWIGAGVTILDGAVIKKGCIIGANSLVNKETVPYGIYFGAPIELVKMRK